MKQPITAYFFKAKSGTVTKGGTRMVEGGKEVAAKRMGYTMLKDSWPGLGG